MDIKRIPRWAISAIAILIGLGLGLLYGWVLDPVKFVDTTPDSLRADYRTDYVLMIAEAYHADRDAEAAVRRLAVLGSDPPSSLARQALQTAQRLGYAGNDVSRLQELSLAMQAYQPAPTPAGSAP
jgi:hypothetical protein